MTSSQTYSLPESDRRTVLLLEADNEFAATVKKFLEVYSCKITRVKNGVDGLQQIISRDFDVILCDMVMPTFPGDKFYIAVERIKPRTCERFIFMTGHKADPKWDAFIRSVRGLTLWKPFQMHDLLTAMRTVFRRSREREMVDYATAITEAPVIVRKEARPIKLTIQ